MKTTALQQLFLWSLPEREMVCCRHSQGSDAETGPFKGMLGRGSPSAWAGSQDTAAVGRSHQRWASLRRSRPAVRSPTLLPGKTLSAASEQLYSVNLALVRSGTRCYSVLFQQRSLQRLTRRASQLCERHMSIRPPLLEVSPSVLSYLK